MCAIPDTSQVYWQGAGSELLQPGVELLPVWEAGILGIDLVFVATAQAPIILF